MVSWLVLSSWQKWNVQEKENLLRKNWMLAKRLVNGNTVLHAILCSAGGACLWQPPAYLPESSAGETPGSISYDKENRKSLQWNEAVFQSSAPSNSRGLMDERSEMPSVPKIK